MRHVIRALVAAALAFAALPASAQTGLDLTRPQLVPPADGRLLAVDAVPRYDVPASAIHRLLAEEWRWVGYGMPSRFAAPHEVSITPESHGVWEPVGRHLRLWRLRIASPGARSLNLGFRRFALPPGARLDIFSLGAGADLGPFTSRDVDGHGQLWTPPIASDQVLITLAVPAVLQHEVALELGFINHGYAGFGAPDPKSGRCNVDLGCTEAEAWREPARAVGLISVSGAYYCTAFLVNNTARDGRPLLMTARHCGVHAGNAASVVVVWNHAFDGCRKDGLPTTEAGRVAPQHGAARRFQTGARWLADDAVSDFVLLELDDPVDPALGLYFAGWDRRDRAPAETVVIHHPNTDAKRLSIDRDPATITSHLSAEGPGNGSHLRIGGWEIGTTEGGSSGSPLFNAAGRVVGLLHGGLAACGNQEPDWFGRLAAAWEGGGQPTSRLRDWLDPLGLGVHILDGLTVDSAPPAPTTAP